MKSTKIFKRILVSAIAATVISVTVIMGVSALESSAHTTTPQQGVVMEQSDEHSGGMRESVNGVLESDGNVYLYNLTTNCHSEKTIDKNSIDFLYVSDNYNGEVNPADYEGITIVDKKVDSQSGGRICIKDSTDSKVSGVMFENGTIMGCDIVDGYLTLTGNEVDMKDVTDLYISTNITFDASTDFSTVMPNLCTIITGGEIPVAE